MVHCHYNRNMFIVQDIEKIRSKSKTLVYKSTVNTMIDRVLGAVL